MKAVLWYVSVSFSYTILQWGLKHEGQPPEYWVFNYFSMFLHMFFTSTPNTNLFLPCTLVFRWHSESESKEGGRDHHFSLDQARPATAAVSIQRIHHPRDDSLVASSISGFLLRYNGKLTETSDQSSASSPFSEYF